MAKYIDREALLAEDFTKSFVDIYDVEIFESIIENAPTADVVEVRHGVWRMRKAIIFDSELVGYNCSECNTTWDTETNYCPNCGAKMDGKGEGE